MKVGSEDDKQIEMDELKRYIEDVRIIKRSLDVADGSFRVFDWFFYAVAGLVLLGTAVNIVVAHTIGVTMHESLVFIWIPVFVLMGMVEMFAWIFKSSHEKLPVLAPWFTRYLVAGGGVLIGVSTAAILLLRPEFPVPGIVLLLTGTLMCITVQYAHFWFLLESLGLVVLGLLFILIGARGEAYLIADGIIVAAVFVVAGVIEAILAKQSRNG